MSILVMIKGLLAAKGAALASGAVVGLAVMAAWKIGLSQWDKFINRQLGLLMSLEKIQDPKEKELVKDIVLSIIKWAEFRIPDNGKGKERYTLAAAQLVKFFPILKNQEGKLAELIEEGVKRMDEALKKAIPQ